MARLLARSGGVGGARGGARAGFTLVEMMVSLAIMSIVVGALGSVIVIATKAIPQGRGNDASLAVGLGLDGLAGELRYATAVTALTPTAVTFTVADRNGDASQETIRYEWSGTAGAPLLRTYNGGTPIQVVPGVSKFDLGYRRRTVTDRQTVTTTGDSGTVLLSFFNGWAGITPTNSTYTLSSLLMVSGYFEIDQVSLPATLTRLEIEQVRLRMRRTVASGPTVTVGIHRPTGAGGPIPRSSAIDAVTFPVSALPSATSWVNIDFSNAVVSSLEDEFAVVVRTSAGGGASLNYYTSASAPTNTPVMMNSSDGGSSWAPSTGRNRQDVLYYVYGNYQWTETTEVDVDTYFLESVDLMVDAGSGGSISARTSVRVLNEPEVAGP